MSTNLGYPSDEAFNYPHFGNVGEAYKSLSQMNRDSLSGTGSLGGAVPMSRGAPDWLDQELSNRSFADERLGKRLRKLVE